MNHQAKYHHHKHFRSPKSHSFVAHWWRAHFWRSAVATTVKQKNIACGVGKAKSQWTVEVNLSFFGYVFIILHTFFGRKTKWFHMGFSETKHIKMSDVTNRSPNKQGVTCKSSHLTWNLESWLGKSWPKSSHREPWVPMLSDLNISHCHKIGPGQSDHYLAGCKLEEFMGWCLRCIWVLPKIMVLPNHPF